jgi:phage terminase large subunit-like protein
MSWRAKVAAAPPETRKAARGLLDGLSRLSPEGRQKLMAQLQASVADYDAHHRLERMFPDRGPLRRALYPKQMAFFKATEKYTEVGLFGGNRTGKSTSAAFAMALFLSGRYPDWWVGRRFPGPVNCWACGTDSRTVRETVQIALLGNEGHPGTGLIPGDAIVASAAKTGTPGAIDSVQVRHTSGGTSRLVFKVYEAGRESFAGARCSCIWLDEEPDIGVYSECLARLTSTVPGERSGLLMISMTPLKGLSAVALRFMPGGRPPGTTI